MNNINLTNLREALRLLIGEFDDCEIELRINSKKFEILYETIKTEKEEDTYAKYFKEKLIDSKVFFVEKRSLNEISEKPS